MKFPKFSLLYRGQKGFTLIELLIVVSITGTIVASTSGAIYQMYAKKTWRANEMTAITNADNTAHWLSRDVKMAQKVEPDMGSGFPLTLTWNDWENTEHRVVYRIIGSRLIRDYYTDGALSANTTIAQFIDPDPSNTMCELTAGGTFHLPDANDAFTIRRADMADNGIITVIKGNISVSTSGTATYNSGAWATPNPGDALTVTASQSSIEGIWTSAANNACAAVTTDADGDANVTGVVVWFTVTSTVGTGSQAASVTKVFAVIPRSSLQ